MTVRQWSILSIVSTIIVMACCYLLLFGVTNSFITFMMILFSIIGVISYMVTLNKGAVR